MAGLSRFDFYPRDWFLDTRDLSHAAKGIYIDLLAAIYTRGAPLPHDETDLCRLTGCKTARSLRTLLSELITKDKIKVVDGHLINGRAMEEIAKVGHLKVFASMGGKARSAQLRGKLEANLDQTSSETHADIVENQCGNECPPSPSPSPSEKEERKEDGAVAPADKAYAFSGDVIRLNESDFNKWAATYHTVMDMHAELIGLDDWFHRENPPGSAKRKDWFFIIRNALNKKHQRLLAEKSTAGGESVLAETNRLYRELGVL